MIARILDRIIGIVSPARALDRIAARATLEQINAVCGGPGGYDAGKLSRLNLSKPNLHENAVSRGQIDLLTAHSRDLYRNNPHARKIVRQIETKTIGKGLRPQSTATKADGSAHVEFRKRAQQIWSRWTAQSDIRGLPGRGGQNFTDQCKSALRSCCRSGNTLSQAKPVTSQFAADRGLFLPLLLQLFDGDRLDDSITSWGENRVYRGIEVDDNGHTVAYHVLPHHPSDPQGAITDRLSKRITVRECSHLFVAEDVDQLAGASWFAAALTPLRDVGDYTYNELKAAAMSACVVASIESPAGTSLPGLASNGPMLDGNGNPITRLQPGMFLQNAKISGFNPQRPNANAEAFTQHLLRIIASSVPGIKGSTLTGDYRQSSFSSEKSADNELWPEIECVQQWFAASFVQPVYEAVIDLAVLQGYFDGIVSVGEYAARRAEFVHSDWQGPVARSINPTDDAEAAAMRVRNGTSSPQLEAAKEGRNSLEILEHIREYVAQVEGLGLPKHIAEQILVQTLGVGSAVDDSTATAAPKTADAGDATADENATDDAPNNRIAHLWEAAA